jgi:hypothetical protein
MPDTDPAEATAVVSTEDEAAPPEAEPTAEATNEETPADDSCPRGPTRRSYAPRAPATGNVPMQATTTRSGCTPSWCGPPTGWPIPPTSPQRGPPRRPRRPGHGGRRPPGA